MGWGGFVKGFTMMGRSWMAMVGLAGLVGAAMVACEQKGETKSKGPGAGTMTPAKLKIAVIPKGTTHDFWKGVERGAKKAGDELGVEIVWKGPALENDRAQQIALVQQFVTDRVSGIVLAPLDDTALLGPVKQATAGGIPVAIIDSGLKGQAGTDFIGYFGTDNKAAGKLGGEHLAKLMTKGAKAVLLRYNAGSASTGLREEGALEGLKAGGVEMASDNQYGEVTPESAKTKAMQMMDTIKSVSESGGGVFAVNESTTLGMLLALRQAGLAGKVKFVGFDASTPLVEALKAGEIDALVVQNPERMGEIGVTSAVQSLRGAKVLASIDTGVVLVTKENMEEPGVKSLLPR